MNEKFRMTENQAWFLILLGIMNGMQRASASTKSVIIFLERIESSGALLGAISQQTILGFLTRPTCLHRFPNQAANQIYNAQITVNSVFSGSPISVFYEEGDSVKQAKHLILSLQAFKGIGVVKSEAIASLFLSFINQSDFSYVDGKYHHDCLSLLCEAPLVLCALKDYAVLEQ